MSYDVFTSRKPSNAGRADSGADFIELSDEGFEDLDPEIESIMMSNDKLVKRLADSVSMTVGQLDVDSIGSTAANKFGRADIVGSKEEELDYDLNLLEQLVRKTIEDYALQRKDDHDPKPKTNINPTIEKINEPSSAHIAVNRSALRPKRKAQLANVNNGQEENGIRLPSKLDQHDSGCDAMQLVYSDCSDLPECESGGQCVVESERISVAEMQLEPRARCRCPIGRGGYLCQKRK